MADTQCSYCGGAVDDGVCEDCGKPVKKASLVDIAAGDGQAAVAGSTINAAKFTVNVPSRKTSQASGTSKTSRRRGTGTSHSSTRRNSLGGGLISLPDQPSQDPLKMLMAVPEVPERKRRCPQCDTKVSRVKGFCAQCGAPYDFEPHLKAGDMVAGKYEIKGPVAFGGLGWIYLGWDTQLSRWVVLKGLLNAKDEASAAAAVAERQFLAAVKNAKIVAIYDFVNFGGEGYIIMEYVGGTTIDSLRKARGPLPVEEAIAYIHGILPAFSYLHGLGMVYCDFKPDNLMLEEGDVKLIDMGAVRKIGDPNGDIFGTPGFMAPEADEDPREVSDLYTIGRTLAVLIMEFSYSSGTYERALPTPNEQAVLADNESLYRFLLRATHPDPDERFQTADQMAEQLWGVLREIVAIRTEPKPADSKVFTNEALPADAEDRLMALPTSQMLPSVRVDLTDRAANEVISALSTPDVRQRVAALQAVDRRYKDQSAEPKLRLIETILSANEDVGVKPEPLLDALDARDEFEWRTHWLRGELHLDAKRGKDAMACFERVYFEMPGEIAPRLAMGCAAEVAGLYDQAIAYYDRVSRVDPNFITANFGLARCYTHLGKIDEAIAALKRVPTTHALRTAAMRTIANLVLFNEKDVTVERMAEAEQATRAVLPAGGRTTQIAADLSALYVRLAKAGKLPWTACSSFLGAAPEEASLRATAESLFRKAANDSDDPAARLSLIARANAIRPVTLF